MRIILLVFLGSVCSGIAEYYDPETFFQLTDPASYELWSYPKSSKPIEVNTSIQVIHFGPVDEQKSQFTSVLNVHFAWYDHRLSLNDSLLHLDADRRMLKRIWRPNVCISDSNSLCSNILADNSDGEMVGIISGDGRVSVLKRLSINGVCKLNIKLYPVDNLLCGIKIESNSSLLRLQWSSQNPIQFSPDFKWGYFDLIKMRYFERKTTYRDSGPFWSAEMQFTLRRQLGYFLLNIYLPSTLFVISSWTSFWVDIPAAPARVALVLTPMLTHVTSTKGIHDSLPKVSYVNTMDIWVMMCTLFIFAAVVEYATANYFYHKPSRKRDRRPPAQSVANLNNNNNNGSEDSESIGSITGSQPNRLVKHVGRYARKVCDKLTPPFGEEDFVARRTGLDIDRRSRYLFPIFFVLFNVIYWITLGVYRSDD